MVYNPKRPAAAGAEAVKNTGRSWTEYVFTLLVGSMYIYSLNRVLISATFIEVTQRRLFIMGVVSLIFFGLIFFNKITRIASAAVVVLGALFVFFTLERWESQIQHVNDISMMIQGYLPYRPELGFTVLWAISLLLGLAAAIFMLYFFSFYLLSLTGIVIFLLTWGPGFTRDPLSFLIFLLCFCLLLIRKTNNGVAAVYVAAPICAALVWFVQGSVPMEADLFQRRTLQELFDGPLQAVGDFIYTLTNPMYFSFQSTGFSGHGGRLGGPITPNARNVMTVQAPGRTYLAGVVHNTYTGYRWHSTLEHGDLYTQGMAPGRFEMLETTAALIRHATHYDSRSTIPMSLLWSIFPVEDHRHLALRHFPVLGQEAGSYMHTYLPMDQVTIAIGANRTGTVFRPQNTRSLAFHAAGPDYLPRLMFDPTGDMRAPGFMARGTQYTMNFLNVNHRLSFIQSILMESHQGLYANHSFAEDILFSLYGASDYIDVYLDYVPAYEITNLIRTIILQAENETPRDGIYITVRLVTGEQDILIVHNGYDGVMVARIPADEWAAIGLDPYYKDDFDFWWDSTSGEDLVLQYLFYFPGHADITVTVEDINALFEMYAFQAPDRVVQYFSSDELIAMLSAFSRDVLAPYAESVREHFMDVPDIVPQRVHDLVAEITYGLDTDFERIMAIRDYLIQFPYTLSPQPVPYGVCFVDHFLFEGREGYCTYYASAMAIMSRIAGVPSRYVEGFLLPPAETEVAIFVVTNMMAHAWVEVYLEGFGWLIVEATAPYAHFIDPTLPPPQGGMSPYWFDDEWWDFIEDYMWLYYFDGIRGRPGLFPPAQTTQDAPVTTRNMPSLAQVRNITLIALAGLAGLIIIFVLKQYIQVIVMAKRIRRMPVNQQITAYFKGILEITSHCSNAKDPAETPYAYGKRVGRRFAFKSDSILLRDLVTLYYKARYGNNQLSEKERSLMQDSYYDMLHYLSREHRRSNYLFLRYIRQIGTIYS